MKTVVTPTVPAITAPRRADLVRDFSPRRRYSVQDAAWLLGVPERVLRADFDCNTVYDND